MKWEDITDEQFEQAKHAAEAIMREIPGIDNARLDYMLQIANNILQHYKNGTKHVICNAPTGFGKSMLAFYISQVYRLLDAKSYILTPNKFLQDQYDNDVKHFNLPSVASLKGASNYTCHINSKPIDKRECDDMPFSKVLTFNTMYQCATKCPYMLLRYNAINYHVTVLNYAFWMLQMVNVKGDAFVARDLTIFDESHQIGNIVQNQFETKLDLNQIVTRGISVSQIIHYIYNRYSEFANENLYINLINAVLRLKAEYSYHRDFQMSDFSTVKVEFIAIINELQILLEKISGTVTSIVMSIVQNVAEAQTASQAYKYATRDEQQIIDYAKYLKTTIDSLKKLQEMFDKFSYRSITCRFSENSDASVSTMFGETLKLCVTFNCAKESEIVKLNVLSNTKCSLWMSATFGNIDDFAAQSGIEDYVKVEVPIQFNFERSPIYQLEPGYDLSYKHKAMNMPLMLDAVMQLVDKHQNERGIIHTGNFEIMKALQQLAKGNKRFIFYGEGKLTKEQAFEKFKKREDAIICGPSLIEGIDLKDDLSRFMIFCKVPYMSLADELTKRKMQMYGNWYAWITMQQIEQGLGRGVRNHQDWCVTYMVDSGFTSFFERYSPPQYILDRLQTLKMYN